MPELAFFRHGEELLRVALGDRTAIGRAPDCDVSLPDPALSRVQAVVERRDDGFHIVDRSGRGTRLGNAEVTEARLTDGAEVALGAWRALFRAAPQPGEETTRAGHTHLRQAARPDEAAPPARIRIKERGRERWQLVPRAGLSVGKAPGNDVVLGDPFVSSRHLRIEPRAGRWHLADLGSTNGTLLGGARVERAELPFGLPLQLGDVELILEPPAVSEAARPSVFEQMVSRDPGMRRLFELVERVAPSDAAVAILGDTGTGKELVARALHARSPRAAAPFIPVNCSAIAETLIESELFGHEKGAFSGAERMRKGAFEEAHGGTIFLDEIGELPFDLQAKLLRTLELGEVKRVGASRHHRRRAGGGGHPPGPAGPGPGRQVPGRPLLPALRGAGHGAAAPAASRRRAAAGRVLPGRLGAARPGAPLVGGGPGAAGGVRLARQRPPAAQRGAAGAPLP